MNDAVAMLAVTIDGYVCRADGSVEYLDNHPADDFPFDAFIAGIGALVMGRISYEQAVGWGWMWGELPTVVLTTRTDLPVPDGADVTFRSVPTAQAIRQLVEATEKRVWIFGGGHVVTDALLGGAVDTLDITLMPEAIGAGVPLFTAPYDGTLDLLATETYSNGAVRLVYRTSDREVDRPAI